MWFSISEDGMPSGNNIFFSAIFYSGGLFQSNELDILCYSPMVGDVYPSGIMHSPTVGKLFQSAKQLMWFLISEDVMPSGNNIFSVIFCNSGVFFQSNKLI